jgi:hypothetical protein
MGKNRPFWDGGLAKEHRRNFVGLVKSTLDFRQALIFRISTRIGRRSSLHVRAVPSFTIEHSFNHRKLNYAPVV